MTTNLQGWLFWVFSVIVVGTLASLASSYLKPRLDQGLGRYSKHRVAKNKELEQYLLFMFAEPSMVSHHVGQMLKSLISSSSFLILLFLFVAIFDSDLYLIRIENSPIIVRIGLLGTFLFVVVGIIFFMVYFINQASILHLYAFRKRIAFAEEIKAQTEDETDDGD